MAKKVKQPHGGKVNQWERGESGNPNGRPRKALRELVERIGVDFNISLSKEDKFSILESMLEMSINELKSIATDKNAPAFMVVMAGAIREDISKGRMNTVNDLFDRFFGKAKQVSEFSGIDGDAIRFRNEMTDEEVEQRIKYLEGVIETKGDKSK